MQTQNNELDFICIGAVGIDTNVYLYTDEINFKVEMNFSENIDNIGQAGGYSSRLLKNLGCKVGFIGFTGLDYHGKFIQESYKAWNIETLWFTDPQGTKRSVNIMNKAGERKNFYDGKGSMKVYPDFDQCRLFLQRSEIIHVNIVNWARHLLPIAKELDITISCDIHIININDDYRRDFIIHFDILFLSAVNFDDVTDLIHSLRSLNKNMKIVIGMGSKGAGLSVKGTEITYFRPPKLHFQIIDTNGAGDSLATGFLLGYYILQKSVQESLLIGQITAQYTCSQKSPKHTLIDRNQLLSIFDSIKTSYFNSH